MNVVSCCVCGKQWDPANPAVGYRSLDLRWWCADETACTDRKARAEIIAAAGLSTDLDGRARMYRALDRAWDQLAKDGWQWPA